MLITGGKLKRPGNVDFGLVKKKSGSNSALAIKNRAQTLNRGLVFRMGSVLATWLEGKRVKIGVESGSPGGHLLKIVLQ